MGNLRRPTVQPQQIYQYKLKLGYFNNKTSIMTNNVPLSKNPQVLWSAFCLDTNTARRGEEQSIA